MTDQELTRWAAEFLWGPEGHNWHFGIEGDLIAHVLPFDKEKKLYAFEGDIEFIHNLNHAFMVVERITGNGSEWGFQLSREDGVYSAGFFDHDDGEWYSAVHENPSRAVLLAAKAALEGE